MKIILAKTGDKKAPVPSPESKGSSLEMLKKLLEDEKGESMSGDPEEAKEDGQETDYLELLKKLLEERNS